MAVVDTTNTTSEVAVANSGSLAVSPTGANAGDVYVTNASSVSVIDPTGTVIYTIPINASYGTPSGVAVAPAGVPDAGYVYVATSGGVVYVIDPSSQSVVGSTDVGFPLNYIAVSPTGSKAGYVYVTDTRDQTVFVISPYDAQNPSTIGAVSVGNGPGSLAISPTGANAGNVYVGNYLSSTVSVIDPSNTVSTIVLGDSTVSSGYAFQPKFVAVSPTGANAGYVYVGGYQGDIAVIDPSGTYVGNIGGSFGYDPGGLAVGPTGANAGNIYLASASDRNLRVLSPAGAVLETTFVGVWASGIAIAP